MIQTLPLSPHTLVSVMRLHHKGSNFGTVTRKAKVKDYYNIPAGNYKGVINYTISLEDDVQG